MISFWEVGAGMLVIGVAGAFALVAAEGLRDWWRGRRGP